MNKDVTPDEETPLLVPEATRPVMEQAKAPTPLPKLQLSILLFTCLAEPFSATVVQPFINQMIGELDIVGGNKAKVGYYVGILYTLFFLAEATMVLHWSRLSDRIGRKPVLLTGLCGIAISITCFGLSTSFWMLVASRSFQGIMNGNTGVMKSMLAEMSDPTNIAQVFALLAPLWAIGSTIAPVIGGSLQKPYDRFRGFNNPFWKQFPYFLPCLTIGLFCAFNFVIALLFLKETVPVRVTRIGTGLRRRISSMYRAASPSEGDVPPANDDSTVPEEAALPLSALLTPNVILAGGNYCLLAMFDISAGTLLSLFLASPAEFGGIGLDPHAIGLLLGAYGIANGFFQWLAFAPLVRRCGIKNVFLGGMFAFLPIFVLFPLINLATRAAGRTPIVWTMLVLLLALFSVKAMSYGAIFIYITAASPDRRSLGATNGIAQVSVSIMRAIGPAMSNSLFAYSVERNIMGGYFVYIILLILTCAALRVAFMLPKQVWKRRED